MNKLYENIKNRRNALAIQLIPEECRIYQQFGDFSLLGNREM